MNENFGCGSIIHNPFVPTEAQRAELRDTNSNYIASVRTSLLASLHRGERSKFLILFVVLIIEFINASAMLGEGSFVGTGGYAIGGTPYYNAGLSYYYDPEMDYLWDGQQWIFETGAQWPPRCCKPNPCSSCGYRRASGCNANPVRVDGAKRMETSPLGSFGASGFDTASPTHHRPSTTLADCPEQAEGASKGANGETLNECWKVYKNHNAKG